MTRRKPHNSLHGRRVISGDAGCRSISFSEERWSNIVTALPKPAADPQLLREKITECCDAFLSAVRAAERGGASVDAITRGGGKQPAPLVRLISQLNDAKKTWDSIRDMHDDRRGPLSDLDGLLTSAISDADRRLAILRSSERIAVSVKAPFIRALAECLRKFGFRPTATGQIYGNAEPTWFQKFVRNLNDQLLGDQGWGTPGAYSDNALFADVAKAMSGYKKPG